MMKQRLLKLFFFLLTLVVLYGCIMSYYSLEKGTVAVVRDLKRGQIVEVYEGAHSFIWYGTLPWLFAVDRLHTERSVSRELRIPIPTLKGLEGNDGAVVVPVRIKYVIDQEKVRNLRLLQEQGAAFDRYIGKRIEGFLAWDLRPSLHPLYRAPLIEKQISEILAAAKESSFEKWGIEEALVLEIMPLRPPVYPGVAQYQEGLRFLQEMKRTSMENSREMLRVKNRLEMDRLNQKALLDKYRDMGALVKENPDILKYIYIDKMADDLKVIISSDKSGLPLFLDREQEDTHKSPRGEVDNLR